VDVVLISLMAMVCGCDDAEDIAEWAELRIDWLTQWFGLQHGTPSQDTILRVFALLKPSSLTNALMRWLDDLRPPEATHIAIDGKTLRGNRDRRRDVNGIHVVSAWLREAGLVLGQVKTDDKSNEITAIPELLRLIDVQNSIVSIDAGGCYREIAAQIADQGGQYVLAVKDNQPTLRADLERVFSEGDDARRRSADELPRPVVVHLHDTDNGHGRIEERMVSFTSDLCWLSTQEAWHGLCGAARVRSRRTDAISGKIEEADRYFITNDPGMTAAKMAQTVRGHWSVENGLHWVLDVVFREDASQIRDRRTAENIGTMRRTALGLLRAAPKPKNRMSIKHQRRYADYRADYLLQVLAQRSANQPEQGAEPRRSC
jgi:predicted transposase YbfD/YdcC